MGFGFINKMIKAVKKYEYVSFDVFDTLLKRDVCKPKDVFLLVQRKFEKHFKLENTDFYNKRVSAERSIRGKSASGEINFNQIYEELLSLYDYTAEQVEYLKMQELEAEKALLRENTAILEFYNYCVSSGKKIVIISDMYLSSEFIGDALKKSGYKYDHIFVSNECDRMKHNGTIYPFILKQLGISKKQIVHIGDSWRADFIFARKSGIKSMHLPKLINNIEYGKRYDKKLFESSLEERSFISFINNKNYNARSEYYKIGYQTFGIVLYCFSKWLNKKSVSDGIENMFFLARDGYIMKKAYDIIYPENNSKYLYVSRRSLTVPSLSLCESFDELCTMLTLTRQMNIKAFLKKLGLDVSEYKDELTKCGLSETTIFDGKNIKHDEKIMKLYKLIEKDVMRNCEKEYSQLISYLKSNEFSGRAAVIDIGWQGTMQKALDKIISSSNELSAEIKGYYVGLKVNSDSGAGFLFSGSENSQNEYKIFSFGGLFETFFLAQHGSVEKYSDNKAVLFDYEYENDENILKIVTDIQQGAIDFVKEFSANEWISDFDFELDIILNNIVKLGNKPSLKVVNLFSEVFLYDTEKYPLIPEKSLFYYIIHVKEFIKGLQQSFWKVGYFKKIFKLKLPYNKIYSLLKRVDK